MQNILCYALLIAIKPIVAWVEPQGYDMCPADINERSTHSSSLLQGVTHKKRAGVTHKTHAVHEVAHDDDLPTKVKPATPKSAKAWAKLSRDDGVTTERKIRKTNMQAKLQQAKAVEDDDVLPKVKQQIFTQAKPQPELMAQVHDDNPKAELQVSQSLFIETTGSTDIGSSQPLLNGTKVEQLGLLALDLKRQVQSALQGAPLQALAGLLTVILGLFLLTGLTVVMRWSIMGFWADHDDEAHFDRRPAPVDKLLLHSHAATMPPTSSLPPSVLDLKSPDAFCPELVVPEGSECVLMVPILPPTVLDVIRDGGDSIFHVVDQAGNTCLCVRVQSFAVAGDGLRVARPGLRERIVLTSATRFRVLAYCERHGLSFHVHRNDDQLVARLNRDEKSGQYSLVSRSGPLLEYQGKFGDHSMRVNNPEGQEIAFCEKGNADRFILRVGPLVDVGLVLCGLFAVDRMEAERLSLRPSVVTRGSNATMASVNGRTSHHAMTTSL